MKKENMKRALSLLLVFALCFTLTLTGMPKAAAADYWWDTYVQAPDETWTAPGVNAEGYVTAEGGYLLFTSDEHRYTYLAKDLLEAANGVVAEDGGEGGVGLFAFGGDFANDYLFHADIMTILKHAIADNFPDTVAVYTKGNHEKKVPDDEFAVVTGMPRIGETAVSGDGLYHFYSFGMVTDQTFEKADIETLAAYLEAHNDGKPIFVISHFPIHYYNDRRSCKNADMLVELLNRYPQTIFLWGHNHTESDPAYATVRFPGDTIQTGADTSTNVEIKFTYASLGALRDGTNGGNGLLVKVNPDKTVQFRYIGLGLKITDDVWVDADGNENSLREPGTPFVISDDTMAVPDDESWKTIHTAHVFVDRPLVDNAPAVHAQDFSDRFDTEEIVWSANGEPFSGNFDFDTAYTATVDLVAKEGYSFAKDAEGFINFRYEGPMGEKYPANDTKVVALDDTTMTLQITFDNTVKLLSAPIEAASSIEEGATYALVAVDDKFAASYRYNPDDHGEESRPEYTAKPTDVVIRDGKLVSEVTPFVTFTASKDGNGYLLYSDASIKDGQGATALNYLTMTTRGGDMGLDASENAGLSIYNNWNVDAEGNPYLNVDGAICYASFAKGGFTFNTDKAACNVKLFKVGTAAEDSVYNVLTQIDAPKTGEKPATTATASGLTVKDVKWEPADETFQPGTAYTVTLTVDAPKPFASVLAARVNGNNANVTIEGQTATVRYTFGETEKPSESLEGATAKKADTLEAGKSYLIVSNGQAATCDFVDGLYLQGANVKIDGDAIKEGITKNMVFTAEATADEGIFYLKGANAYLAVKSVDNTPDCWGITTSDKPAMTVSFTDGTLLVEATGAAAGGPGGPPPGGGPKITNSFYWNDGHFNFSSLQKSDFTIFEVDVPFQDVAKDAWYYDAVNYAAEHGLMNGVGDYKFAPEGVTSRAQIVTILYRLEGEPETEASKFQDLEKDSWYEAAVNWAAANEIVKGVSETRFDPNSDITREQMATILYRYATYKKYDTSAKGDLAGYKDREQVSDWAVEAMTWANGCGLIQGVSSTKIDPAGNATRAQAATILMRFCENIAK